MIYLSQLEELRDLVNIKESDVAEYEVSQ